MKLIWPAYPKLNLTLDVLGRRDDGYHEVASVLQTVSMHDLVAVEPAPESSLELTGLEVAGDNLALKALRLLEAHAGRPLPLRIRLHKRVPVGAGLGGGSADAATVLRAAVRLHSLSISEAELGAVAAAVGQDVPFLLHGGTGLATGRGGDVEPLPPLPPAWAFLVACPRVQISTRRVYEARDGSEASGGRTQGLVAALRAGRPVPDGAFGNDLERTARLLYPDLEQAASRLQALAPGATMTGSGAAFFMVFPHARAAHAALSTLHGSGFLVFRCRPVRAWD